MALPTFPAAPHGERAPLLRAEHHGSGNSARSETATVGRRHFRQCEPLCQFRRKRCAVKLSLRNVTAAHSPKNLDAVRVFFYRSFVEALDRDIQVQPTNLQIHGLLNHTTPVMARPRQYRPATVRLSHANSES